MDVWIQVESEFILESERDSFIEQVREVIENADEKGLERDVEKQVQLFSVFSFKVSSFRVHWF